MFSLNSDVISVVLSSEERSILAQIPQLLDAVEDSTDPGYAVLHRPLYPQDTKTSDELADLVKGEMEVERRRDRAIVAAIAGGETSLSQEEAKRFLRSVNEGRIVLAARSGAFEAGASWESDISDDPALAAVAWLGYVQSELVRALVS